MKAKMRFNKKELAQYSSSGFDFEGRLNYRTAGGNFTQPAFKERWFRLKSNFLFYFRLTDLGLIENKEPAGVFVLENVKIQKEERSEMSFAFSLIFKDEPDYKHLFSARSADLVSSWINAIQECSYEHLRNKLDTYQNMIKSVAGVENLQLSPYVNKRLLSSQSVKVQSPGKDEAGKLQSKLRPKTESFKCHVPLFDPKAAQLPPQTNNIFCPPANATPVRPARSSDLSRTSSPSASPVRVPIRKPPPPPSKDLIEF